MSSINFQVLAAILLSAASLATTLTRAADKPIATRFGPLSWSSEGQLQFRGVKLAVEYGAGWPEPHIA